MISGVSSRLFQPYTCTAPGPIRDEAPEPSPFLKLPDIPSRQYVDLRNHPGFGAIKTQFLGDIDEMGRLATGFVGNTYKEAIETFRNNIDEPPEYIESGLFPIFDETRHQIHKIVARMKALSSGKPASPADSTSERDRISQALHICLNEIDHCPAGVQSRFTRACRSLEAEPEQLDARLFLIRKSLLEEFSHAFLRLGIRDGFINVWPGDEIHWVNALFNAVCDQFGLNTIADPLAPRHIRQTILALFRSKLRQALSEYTVLHTLASDYYQRFCHFLDNKNLRHWRTEIIAPGKLTYDHVDELEHAILTPMNKLCDVQDREKTIKLSTLIEDDEDQYSFARCREKIQGWLTRTIMDAPATLFSRIPCPPDGPQKCIGTYNNLFFWVFETSCPPESVPGNSTVAPFDAGESRALTIADLLTIDVFSWPESVQLALLNQAMEQTGVTSEDVRNVSTFVLGKKSGKTVEDYPVNVQNAVASLLTGKMTSSPGLAAQFVAALGPSFTESIPYWVFKTPLLEPLLLALKREKRDIHAVADTLPIWQLMSFSPSSLKTLFTPEWCKVLFHKALNHELGGLMWRLLQTGHCDVMNNHVNTGTQSVLMVLCEQGIADGVAYLVNTLPNTDINSKNTLGLTALHFAVRCGHKECLNKLLDKDNINLNDKDNTGWTALHFAARHGHTECLNRLLIKDNIDLNEKDNKGWTALHFAIQYGHSECLNSLLARDSVALHEKNSDGWTALHLAVVNRFPEYLKKLSAKDGNTLNEKTNDGWTALHLAVGYGHPECLKTLLTIDNIHLNEKNSGGLTALHLAILHNNLECLKILLARDNIDLDEICNQGRSAVHYAAANGHTECLQELLGMDNIVLNERDNIGWTALHHAASNGHTGCLRELLLKQSIRVNTINHDGFTPLMEAVAVREVGCVELLLGHDDIELNIADKAGFDAFTIARSCQYQEIVDMMQNHSLRKQ